jgi:D-3-phosphoglycerate dehydrogenase
MRICVPDDAPPVLATARAWQAFHERFQPDYYDTLPGSTPRLIERIATAEVVINIRSSSQFTAEVFQACPSLKMISIWGTGTDNIDLDAARRHGVTVTNTPGVSAPSIAEHALALLLALARRIPYLDAQTRAGQWARGGMVQLAGKTCGVIGTGAIGARFAQLAAAVGMNVLTWSFRPKPELPYPAVELEQLLRDSDVVSLHLRLSAGTHHFLNRERLALLKPSALLVNTARGAIVDEAALVEMLEQRRIAGAALDVFEVEPLPSEHRLKLLDNVVLTPHCAGITPEVLEAGLSLALNNVEAWLGGAVQHRVV